VSRTSRTRDEGVRGADALATRPSRRRRLGLNGRALAAILVMVLAVLQVAEPVQRLIAQRSEIAGLQTEIDVRQAAIADLERRKERLRDPAYVARLARERLHFVMPGEVGYVVLEPGEEDAAGVPLTVGEAATLGPWWARLWRGIQIADDPSLAQTPTTEISIREEAPR
jgi:cell division protein FtsB